MRSMLQLGPEPMPSKIMTQQSFRMVVKPRGRDTFAKAPAARAQNVSSLTGVSGGGILTSSASSTGSAGASSSALAAPGSSIFTGGGGSSGGIFSLSASSGAATGATSAASSGSIFGTAAGSTFGSAGSIFGQGAGAGAGPAGAAFGAAASAQSGPSMFAQAFQQSRPGPGAARPACPVPALQSQLLGDTNWQRMYSDDEDAFGVGGRSPSPGDGRSERRRDDDRGPKGGSKGGDKGRQDRRRTTGREIPKLYSIHKGTVARVQDYGAFVRLGDGSRYKRISA
ncbi:hypothetical protein AK812_SmicGene26774 [Symbiodinium microadriaticum]|uniref:Uncharacterized protein n=1 Tax=Symbiodinium microadriaticum TaxID=2951 RepID=A0A1Q9D8Q2_SYMMI|nr:hypothetical protein AK812_SmicGene26774 [Symbiodinium microadriaticum]